MRARAVFGVGTLGLMMAATPAWAQSCADVLRFGIWESKRALSAMSRSEDGSRWVCENAQRGSSGALAFAVPGVFSIEARGGGERARRFCADESSSLKLDEVFQINEQTTSLPIVAAWERCMSGTGNRGSVIHTPGTDAFQIRLQRNAEAGSRTEVSVNNITVSPDRYRCPASGSASGVRVSTGTTVACRFPDRNETALITVTFDYGDEVNLTVPAVARSIGMCDRVMNGDSYRLCFDSNSAASVAAPAARRMVAFGGVYIGKFFSPESGARYFWHSGPDLDTSNTTTWRDGLESDRRTVPQNPVPVPGTPRRCNVNLWGGPWHFDDAGRVFAGYAPTDASSPAAPVGSVRPWPRFESATGGRLASGEPGPAQRCD